MPTPPVKDTIAIVLDFDDTLMPDSTRQFVKERFGVAQDDFSKEITNRTKSKNNAAGDDAVFGFLNYMLELVRSDPNKKVGNQELAAFGKTISNKFYPGVAEVFKRLKNRAEKQSFTIKEPVGTTHKTTVTITPKVQFYLVSGGLEPLVRAAMDARGILKYFDGIVACELGEVDGQVSYVKRAVSFTEKTRYLYAINKGVFHDPNPYAVNAEIEPEFRPIPFEYMIYLGDGYTDIPCFSMLSHFGGTPIPILPADKSKKYKDLPDKYQKFIVQRKLKFLADANYKPGSQLGRLLDSLIDKIVIDMKLNLKYRP